MNRQTEFGCKRDQNAATRGAVELGHHQTGDASDLTENLRLAERVLADRCIEYEEDRMWGGWVDLTNDAHHFFKLAHQLSSILQTARSIDEDYFCPLRVRRLDRVESKTGGVGTRLARHDARVGTLAPNFQLIDRGSPKGVS